MMDLTVRIRMPMRAPLLLSLAVLVALPAAAQTSQDATPTPSIGVAETDDTLFQRARATALDGRRDEAIRLYSELLDRDPGHVDARLGRGRTHAWMRRWTDAEADLQAVTAASPQYADAWSALGDMYLWSDRPEQAVAAYARWRELQPADPRPLMSRSRAYRALGSKDDARADLQAAVGLGADQAAVNAALAALDAPERMNNPDAIAPVGFTWSVQAGLRRTRFSDSRADWNDRDVVVRRYLPRGSVAVELLETRRYGRDDKAWAIDAYVDTWSRAYANLRYQHAPDEALFPGHAWRAELFQGIGQGWELSAGVDQLRFRSTTADIYSLGVGRYTGNFYLRARSRYSPDSDSLGHTALVRYYHAGNAHDYLELSAGTGRSEDERFGRVVDEDSRSAGLTWMQYLTPNLGFRLTADYTDATPHESKAGATVYYRW